MIRLDPGSRSRRLALALAVWACCTLVYLAVDFAVAPRRLTAHTPFNHFALLADAWLHGSLALPGQPPAYTEMNDFAQWRGAWFISFPAFPAVLLVPLVKFAGSPENVRDGQFWVWLAGVGPAVLFLVLEKLRRSGHATTSERAHLGLAGLFAFGTVYFFTAEQGTVWFAAHVVGVQPQRFASPPPPHVSGNAQAPQSSVPPQVSIVVSVAFALAGSSTKKSATGCAEERATG